jgi:hypothetical protein
LAKYFKTELRCWPFGNVKGYFYGVRINSIRIKSVFVEPMPEGVFLCVFGFSWIFPKLLIPWSAIRLVETNEIFGLKSHSLKVTCPDGVVDLSIPGNQVIEYGQVNNLIS